jgi:ABC-type cobalamin transport system permease subunit
VFLALSLNYVPSSTTLKRWGRRLSRGRPEFVGRLCDQAANLALFFVGEPEEKMLAALEQTRRNIEAEIAPILGAEMAAAIATGFVGAVVGHRREIEAAGEMPRGLN